MIPLWIKIIYTIFLFILVPVYFNKYGPANFLWFSDIALFGTWLAMWLESGMIASMMAVGVLVPEIAWNIDFFFRLLSKKKLIGLSDYMFDSSKPRCLRGLSLFHVVLPVILLWVISITGYDESAIFYQIILSYLVLLVSRIFTDPKENINWVFGPGNSPQKKIPGFLYMLILFILFPLVFFLPTHFFLKWLF